jgi:glycosyltransferase involved in cell wall biosynthesis
MIRENRPLVSIVVPVYNGAEFLVEALDSVLAQTYDNWDLLIVNNCSTDRTLEIAEAYATTDSRVQIHNNREFLPMMANINNAFRRISGRSRYCKMLLADDMLFPECIEKMVSLAEAHPSVGIVGAYGLAGHRLLWEGLPFPSPIVNGRELSRATLQGGPYIFGSATSLLFRAELVRARDPFYEESNVHGDYTACLDLLRSCDFGFVHQVLTYTRRRKDSATSFSRDYNTYLLEGLNALLQYGPVFLNPLEAKQCLSSWQREYYAFLAKSVLRLKDRDFWRFHTRRLASLGQPLSTPRLALAVLVEALYGIFHPQASLVAVRESWRHALHRLGRIPSAHDNPGQRSAKLQSGYSLKSSISRLLTQIFHLRAKM